MQELSRFATRYLEQWERRSTVRTMGRYAIPEGAPVHRLFPVSQQPLAAHPLVVAKGEDAVSELLVRTCHKFMSDIAYAETDVVCRLCADLAHESFDFEVPRAARQAALTIATDEEYHAFAAREFMWRVADVTGIQPDEDRTAYGYYEGMEWARRTLPDEVSKEFRILILCIAENSITEEVFGMARDTEPDNPFHHISREHLLDEGRHRQFFQIAMREVWAAMSEEKRRAAGAHLPEFLGTALLNFAPYRRSYEGYLRGIGLAEDEMAKAFDDMFLASQAKYATVYDMPHMKNVANLLRGAGILDHAPTVEAFAEARRRYAEKDGERSDALQELPG